MQSWICNDWVNLRIVENRCGKGHFPSRPETVETGPSYKKNLNPRNGVVYPGESKPSKMGPSYKKNRNPRKQGRLSSKLGPLKYVVSTGTPRNPRNPCGKGCFEGVQCQGLERWNFSNNLRSSTVRGISGEKSANLVCAVGSEKFRQKLAGRGSAANF